MVEVLIYSRGRGAYWGPDGRGYYSSASDAGVYDKEDAEKRTAHCGTEKGIEFCPVPDDHPVLLRRRITELLLSMEKSLAQAFVDGAKWWEWKTTGFTMWQSDQNAAFAAWQEKQRLRAERGTAEPVKDEAEPMREADELTATELEIAHEIGHDVPGYITGALPLPAKEDPINQMCVRHRMLAMVRRIVELEAEIERRRKERAEILNVKTTEGLTCSEWICRTAAAEAEKKRLKTENAELSKKLEQLKSDGEDLDWMEAQMQLKNCWLPAFDKHSGMWFITDEDAYATFRAALKAARERES